MQNLIVEVCADSVESAVIAQQAGAYRIELCAALSEGGVTPSAAMIRAVRRAVAIKLYVIIRPRDGDFLYTDDEFAVMLDDIRFCGENGCDGVVVGILTPDGSVDKPRCRRLVELAAEYGMGVTFHRAIDRSRDIFAAMEAIIDIGCERILTSGGAESASEGVDTIRELIRRAEGRIAIMPGAGVTPENINSLIAATDLTEVHGTFRSPLPSRMTYVNAAMRDDETTMRADPAKIRRIVAAHAD
jgi:copper homeostasis protein